MEEKISLHCNEKKKINIYEASYDAQVQNTVCLNNNPLKKLQRILSRENIFFFGGGINEIHVTLTFPNHPVSPNTNKKSCFWNFSIMLLLFLAWLDVLYVQEHLSLLRKWEILYKNGHDFLDIQYCIKQDAYCVRVEIKGQLTRSRHSLHKNNSSKFKS